jgi:hypothetical protein
VSTTHESGIEAAAVVAHLKGNGPFGRCDAHTDTARAGVFDHVGQSLLGDAVQMLLGFHGQGQTLARTVDLDQKPFPATERRRLLGERSDQPFVGKYLGVELEDERTHLRQSAPGQLTDLAQLRAQLLGGIGSVLRERPLCGSDVQDCGEQRLRDGVVQVAANAVSFLGGALALAALRLGQLQ